MKKVILCMALLLIVVLIAACGRGNNGGTNGAGQGQGQGPQVPELGDNLVLPLVEQPVTFTVWTVLSNLMGSQLEALHESYYYQELARRTNVHIEFMHPPAGGEQESLNLIIAAGDIPDVMELQHPAIVPAGGLSRAIQDGLLLDVRELVENYAPYYWNAIHSTEDRRRNSFTDEGYLPGFWQLKVHQPPWFGMATRQDWLDELGLDMPITYDDWHHALSLFRDEFGATAPMMLPMSGFVLFDSFHAGFDFSPNFFQVNGEVRYGPLEPGFRDYIYMMAEWFADGLIDPDFSSRAFFAAPQDFTTTGLAGLWQDIYVLFPINNLVAPDPSFRTVAVPPPVRYVGQTVHLSQSNPPTDFLWTVTTSNHDPVLFMRWMNYNFSHEGFMLANWGIEGETFEFDANGNPQFMPKIYDNPDGFAFVDALRRYVRPPSGGIYYDWHRELTPGIPQDVYDAPGIWESNVDFAFIMPPITLSADESVEFSRIMADVNTHRDEMVARFITGSEPMANFDDFIATLHNMGVERAIELQQGALDRYHDR